MTLAYLPPVMSDVIADLSHFQATPDFAAWARNGIVAVILKATQGSGYVDPTYAARADAAAQAGLLVGAYHYLDGSPGADQADHFLSVAGDAPFMAFDYEPAIPSFVTQQNAEDAVKQFEAMMGRWPVLYCDRFNILPANPVLSSCPLWLAEYGTEPICPPGWDKWMLWQYTDQGSVITAAQVTVPLDRSQFAGSADDLRKWWGS